MMFGKGKKGVNISQTALYCRGSKWWTLKNENLGKHG